ncbi:uncharacterized protein [Amphiura filiformis]|uniref:uncharacterized protein n=1 Tax=Amphiura filiformis TaxID=82378 RepID=UPI003B216482
MVSQATSSSSFYATAELYATLTDTLQQLANLKPAKFCNDSAGIRFAAYSSSSCSCSVPPLGYFTPRSSKLGTWVLLKHFASRRQINQGRGIIVHTNSDIAVADIGAGRVAVYNKLGEFKFPIQGTRGRSNSGLHTGSHGIAVSANGLYFVTGIANLVEVFNADGALQYKFPAVSPSNVSSNQEDEDTNLIGIAVDAATQHVLVGDIQSKYISKHRLDGTHISSIQVDIQPWYIQVTPQSVIVASSYEENAVNMYDQEGLLLHNCSIPTGLLPDMWYPTGLCVAHDLIFVNNFAPNSGMYCFCALTGKYLRMIANNMVNWGAGITSTEVDGRPMLLVSQGRWTGNESGVKVFALE